ncbi:MAG: Beta-glucuronidase [Clostridia bacterium]|jgi:beta-glucuronidase|nr:Beta-glucuronidase [Clostridia bacterium]
MLYPQLNCKRSIISLDGFWKFAVDYENNQENNWYKAIPEQYEIAVPASWNEQHQDLMNFFETGWYEKEVFIPRMMEGSLLHLRIGAANYLAKVWVNGHFMGEHTGGHLPFEFEISHFINYNQKNKIVIAVDARFLPDRLPPGNVEDEQIIGFKGQYPNNYYDFFPYGGIERSVVIYSTDKTYISQIKIDTEVIGRSGVIHYHVNFNKIVQGYLKTVLNGVTSQNAVNNVSSIQGSIKIDDAILWSPQNPYLYELEFTLNEHDIEDHYIKMVGIRTIEIQGTKLLLNGEEIFLRGFGMHEDFPVLGKGVNESIIIKDFNMLKWMGANSIRTSHYPYSEEFLDYADRKGLLIIGETPFVDFVRSHYKGDKILNQAKKVIGEMIHRDYNHPCIIMWSLANEGDTFVAEADAFYKALYDYARSLDDKRPISIVNCVDIEGDVALKHFDVICLNRYYGWYEQAGRIDLGCSILSSKLDECYEVFKKPIMITEFGADAIQGIHFDPPQQFSEEYQADMVTKQYKIIESKKYTIGAHIWCYADFKTSQCPSRVVMNRKGLLTRERQPKLAAHAIRKLWKEKLVYI